MKISKFGILLILIGVLFLLSTYGVFNLDLSRDWPWILIIVGVFSLIRFDRRRKTASKIRDTMSREERIKILKDVKDNKIDVDEAIRKFRDR